MRKIILFCLLFTALNTFAQKKTEVETVYRYLYLKADSTNNQLFEVDEVKTDFYQDLRKAVIDNRINLYSEDSDNKFVFPTVLPAVEYVIDKSTGQAQKEIKRVSYFEMDTDEKKTIPNNQDIYEAITRPMLGNELKEIRVMEKGTWNKKNQTYEFEPIFLGFVRNDYNDIFKNSVWVSIEELNDLTDFQSKSWVKFFNGKSYSAFPYKQYGYEPTFAKEDCLHAKWKVIERIPENEILFKNENPSYSFLGEICRLVEDGFLKIESSNPIRYAYGDADEVFMTRRSTTPLVDDAGEPILVVNDAGEMINVYVFDVELHLRTSKLKYIKVREEGGLAQTLHFIFDENGEEIEYFSIAMNDVADIGMMVTHKDWYTFLRLMKYKANTIRQSSCDDIKMRN